MSVSKILIEEMILRPTRDPNPSNALSTELARLECFASLTGLICQIQEFENLDLEIDNLVLLSFAEKKSDSVVLLFSLLGGLDSPTFRLPTERASRLRHKSSIINYFMKKRHF